MAKPYKYQLRPGYGSGRLLLEFPLESGDVDFDKDLFIALKEINPKPGAVDDLWMNDEILLQVNSEIGTFSLSKDIWNVAFILAENNQSCIELIDRILKKSHLFENVASIN